MREAYIERKLVDKVKHKFGLCLKFTSPGFTGVPDRIVLMPNGIICFVETKATGGKIRPRQAYVHKQFRNLGFKVVIIDSIESLNNFINEI